MSDGHLFLSDRGSGVDYVGDTRSAWHDEAHDSVLVLSPRSHKLLEISLRGSDSADDASSSSSSSLSMGAARWMTQRRRGIARSKSAPALSAEHGGGGGSAARSAARETHCGVSVLYDFSTGGGSSTMLHGDTSDSHSGEHSVALMRLSLDRQFLAIQKSDIEVQIVRLATGESFWIVCKPKAGNRILMDGVLWNTHSGAPQSSQDVFLITKLGIEQYRVSPKRRSCVLHRTIGVYTHAFWYSASHSVLILSTGSRANEIVPFHLQGASVEKLPRLVFSTAVRYSDLYLASLYGELYAVYGDMKSPRLLLYLIGKTKVSCVRSLNLMLPGGTGVEFSVVDNLLVCHSVDFNVSLFFDVKCDGNIHDPFSHPLPVSLTPPQPLRHHLQQQDEELPATDAGAQGGALTKSASFDNPVRMHDDIVLAFEAADGERSPRSAPLRLGSATPARPPLSRQASAQMDHHESDVDGLYFSRWRFLPPDLVHRSFTVKGRGDLSDHVEIRRLQLNVAQVCRSCAQHAEILPFLLRRGDQELAKSLALGIVREKLQEQALPPAAASALLAAVQTVSPQELDGGGSEDSANETSSDDELRTRYGPRVVPLSIRKHFFRDARESDEPFSASALKLPARNANGATLIFQSEFAQHLWTPLLEDSEVARSGALSMYLLEFIKLLRLQLVPVENLTYLALAQSFLAARKPRELYQVLQHSVASDSTELADLLVQHSPQYPVLRQLALDMYMRLGAIAALVHVLLDGGEPDQAIAVAREHMDTPACDASMVSACAFFESSVRSLSTLASFEVQQRLQSLLLFLREWDPDCLVVLDNTTAHTGRSLLAQSTTVAFPDELLAPRLCAHWRKLFGFPTESVHNARSHETLATGQAGE